MKKAFISDCEGPISKNDNAYELTSHFVPNGNKLFVVISRYDDVLAEILKRPDYKAGYTLKLILPFLKAHDVTDWKMHDFSAKKLVLIPNAEDTLKHVRSIAHAFVVSTSYEPYIRALCKTLDFPFGNTYCTKVNLDKYHITEHEKNRLKELEREIIQMPVIEVPREAKSAHDLSRSHYKAIRRLDEIFWKEMADMESGRIYSEVDPMGAGEKATATGDIARKLGVSLADVMYVGDSITDEKAFQLVRENNGLAVSFNGNQYAVRNAEIAVMSANSTPTAIIADTFCRFGKQQTLKLAKHWSAEALNNGAVNPRLLELPFKPCTSKSCRVETVTRNNVDALGKKSSQFRMKVRGEAIGRLG